MGLQHGVHVGYTTLLAERLRHRLRNEAADEQIGLLVVAAHRVDHLVAMLAHDFAHHTQLAKRAVAAFRPDQPLLTFHHRFHVHGRDEAEAV